MMIGERKKQIVSKLQSYQGKMDRFMSNLEGSLKALTLYSISVTLIACLLAVLLTKKEQAYQTIMGIETSGYVSENTAEMFARDFLKWMHHFNHMTIKDRTPYLSHMVCPSQLQNFTTLMTKEDDRIIKNSVQQYVKISPSVEFRRLSNGAFGFQFELERYSTIANQLSLYKELYSIIIQHEVGNDNTLKLCVAHSEKLKSTQEIYNR